MASLIGIPPMQETPGSYGFKKERAVGSFIWEGEFTGRDITSTFQWPTAWKVWMYGWVVAWDVR